MSEVQMPGCSGEGDGEIKVNITKELMKSYILFKLRRNENPLSFLLQATSVSKVQMPGCSGEGEIKVNIIKN